jgi:hypothetical protein
MSDPATSVEKQAATYPAVQSVEATEDHKLLLRFASGDRRIFDVSPLLSFGRFSSLTSPGVFKKVRVAYDSVEWENGLDLDPEYLYERSQPCQG